MSIVMDKLTEVEIVECTGDGNVNEIASVVVIQNEEKEKQLAELSGVQLHQQATSSNDIIKESENMHELSTVITDVYSLADKFGHELIQFNIEPEHSLENWQNHGYSQTETGSFSHTNQIENSAMQPCHEDMQSTSEPTVTLTVLNSTNNDEAGQSIPFSLTQPVTHSSLIDHNYYAYPKPDYPVTDGVPADNTAHMQEQNDMEMDPEKLQRMKRRKEKNRECSRQFRLKQKDKEQRLTLGKVEKTKTLDTMKRNVEKLKAILSKISQKCSSCPKTAMLLTQYVAGGDKENINPNIVQDLFT